MPFSIEYWSDKTYLIHTKTVHASGNNKVIFYAGDIKREVLFARCKPRSIAGKNKLEKEAQKIDSFSGSRGLVQNGRTSYYLNKTQDAQKFHMIQELYEGTFDSLKQRQLSDDELKIIALDLINGLAAIHAKGLIHDDIKDANIIYQVNQGVVIKCVLCDLGETTDGSNFLPSKSTPFILKKAQLREVDHLLGMFRSLYRSQNKPYPEIIDDLTIIPDMKLLRDQGIMPRDAVSAPESLDALNKHYKTN